MGMIRMKIEDDKLLKRITIRAQCIDEESEKVAILLLCRSIEESPKFNVRVWNEYIEDDEKSGIPLYSTVSITVLYNDETAKNNFLEFIKNIHFL